MIPKTIIVAGLCGFILAIGISYCSRHSSEVSEFLYVKDVPVVEELYEVYTADGEHYYVEDLSFFNASSFCSGRIQYTDNNVRFYSGFTVIEVAPDFVRP